MQQQKENNCLNHYYIIFVFAWPVDVFITNLKQSNIHSIVYIERNTSALALDLTRILTTRIQPYLKTAVAASTLLTAIFILVFENYLNFSLFLMHLFRSD